MTAPYRFVSEVVADRLRWSRTCLAELVRQARAEGWMDGEPAGSVTDHASIRAEIDARLDCAGLSVETAPMEWLKQRLGLSVIELDALWLLASIELDPAVARLAQAVCSGDLNTLVWQRLLELSAGRGLRSAECEHLLGLGLVETNPDPTVPVSRRSVRVNDRVLELARGEVRLDAELDGVARVQVLDGASTADDALAASPAPIIVAVGAAGSGRRTALRGIAGGVARATLEIEVSTLAAEPARQLRAICREARLFGFVPMLVGLDCEHGVLARSIERELLCGYAGPILATARAAPSWIDSRPIVTRESVMPDAGKRLEIWQHVLPDADVELLRSVASSYAISPAAIIAAATSARASTPKITAASEIHDGLRAFLGKQIGTLATRIEWRQTWRDLVIPRDQFDQVIELVARVRHRTQVLDTWGFGAKVGKGRGVTALMSGPPGTGKTMMAGLIARELGLDLYQVDLSRIVSKYIGETEKNLAVLFDAAESGHAILLFDEADSLFSKRSEVKSSNDRYANLEVNYLLQRMEAFGGISLLTTNHESALDEAFRRRIALHVRFPMPDENQRAALWQALVPEAAETSGELGFADLAQEFEMSGGYIKNAVLRAAYLAANERSPITAGHMLKGARAEYEAMGKMSFQGSP